MSFSTHEVSVALAALDQAALDGLQLFAAATVATHHYPLLDPARPLLLWGLDGAETAARLKAVLLHAYPPEHPIVSLAGGERHEQSLAQLGAGITAGHIFVGPRGGAGTFEALQDVVARLRAPDGCPWDRALTWAKLRASLLEESHELLAALDAEDPAKVLEEQGDLLLQVALQVQIASEEGRYRLPDVVTRIVDKLVRRHPHVFGDAVVSGTDEVLANWEAIKAAERAQNGEKARSPLAGVPAGLPALAQAEAYLDRMSRLSPHIAPQAPWTALADLPHDAELTPELLGQTLLGLVSWALARGVEAESALRAANARYAAHVAAQGWG